jgi:hypothetical protein
MSESVIAELREAARRQLLRATENARRRLEVSVPPEVLRQEQVSAFASAMEALDRLAASLSADRFAASLSAEQDEHSYNGGDDAQLGAALPGTARAPGVPGANTQEGTVRPTSIRIQLPGKPLTPVQRRLLDQSWTEGNERLAFQHTVFCQTSLPFRNPGDDVRLWQRAQGAILLQIQAGQVANPATHGMVKLGLPWGTKPRLILAYLNAVALRQGSPEIEVENSLTAFVKRVRGFDAGGREIRAFRDQLKRLSASDVRLVLFGEKHAQQIETRIITAFDLWPESDVRQRALWPSVIHLSHDYFESLQEHAVPLNEADLGALAHSAVALDLYSWMAQRLHRIVEGKPQFIPWTALKSQFGPDFGRMDNFKKSFRTTLQMVLSRYRNARVELDNRGMTARCSPTPVPSRYVLVRGAEL